MASYYHDHLAFLLEGGRGLAAAFPRAADRLGQRGFDPDVERILEGIAYITGKVDEKHDQGLPEVCQLIFDILFPHYLSPLPSATIVELSGEPHRLPAGSDLESVPVLGTGCRFRTAYDVELGPLSLTDVLWQTSSRGAALTLQLAGTPEGVGGCERLRVHLHGEPLLTRSLYQWLQTRVDGIELLDAAGAVLGQARGLSVKPVGFGEEEALLLHPLGTFGGFRLLQEYFTFPQKFLFLDLCGLSGLRAALPPGGDRFALRFHLRVDAARSFAVTRQSFRLACTPVVNLFDHSSDPLLRVPGRADYLLRPAGPTLHYQIYRVTEVQGRGPRGTLDYPLLSELDLESRHGRFCQVHRRQVGSEIAYYLSLSDGATCPTRQTILVDLLCCNGQLASGLRVGDICGSPALRGRSCRILTPVTTPAAVPVGEDLRWRLVMHLALSQRELTTLTALREALTLYDIPALWDRQVARGLSLLLEGLLGAETRLVQTRHRRTPIWGQETTLELAESAFDTPGELYLFGAVLNEYVALQAPVNTFTELAIRQARSGELHRWAKRLGRKLLESC